MAAFSSPRLLLGKTDFMGAPDSLCSTDVEELMSLLAK
jgi:hypothetical protein